MERLKRQNAATVVTLGLMLIGLAMGVAALGLVRPNPAKAIAPCVPHTLSNDELGFLASLQAWRNTNIAGSHPLTQSTHLNAAAQGYAQFLANTPGAGGHNADGSSWSPRAISCGYPVNQAAGGEGVANAVTASQALTMMTGGGSIGGVWVPSNVGAPVKCVGVGKATSSDGTKTSWVTLIFAAFGECPGATSGGGSPPTVPASATTPATATPTKTATPSPTPSPTPTLRADGATLTIYEGWNLVTLPAGNAAEVLHRAQGCYRAIYQQNGSRWLRYSPEAPAYANNLQTLNGGTFWIEGTAANCGAVRL